MNDVFARIEADQFFVPTYGASTHAVVELMLQRSDELTRLATPAAATDRVLEDRAKLLLSRPPAKRMPLIAYAILLKQRRDPAAVPLFVEYLRSISDGEASAALSPWNPFYYVVDALCRITGAPRPDPGMDVFVSRRSIADAGARWYAQTTHARAAGRQCPKCHRAVGADKKFCTACGARIAP